MNHNEARKRVNLEYNLQSTSYRYPDCAGRSNTMIRTHGGEQFVAGNARRKVRIHLTVKIKGKRVLARCKVSVAGQVSAYHQGTRERRKSESRRKLERGKNVDSRKRDGHRDRERGEGNRWKELGRSTPFGVCKHLPRGLLLPQPSLSGFVKALGALIPGCRMRHIGRRARALLTHTICLPVFRPLNLFSFAYGTVCRQKSHQEKRNSHEGANIWHVNLSVCRVTRTGPGWSLASTRMNYFFQSW